MARDRVLLDAGPLVALLSVRDQHHALCAQALANTHAELVTCWPVVTEAAHLLRSSSAAVDNLLHGISRGTYCVLDLPPAAAEAMRAIVRQYQSSRIQIADAALAVLADLAEIDTIITLDRRDFSILRTPSGRTLKIIP